MKAHLVKPRWSKELLPRDQQLAWQFALLASDGVSGNSDAIEMAKNRIIDNASVALASLNRRPPAVAREMALCHPKKNGAAIFGVPSDKIFSPEWVAWANGTAVRELDFHDTFLAADYSHPGDNIPPILAVAQTLAARNKISGEDFLRGVLVAYEVQVALVKSICLHQHAIDHIAHLAPSMVAGIGAMLGLDKEIIYQAIGHALHVCIATRQSRKGEISSWKAFAPAHAGKLSIEAVDRAMRGENSPSPIYEGEDSVLAKILGGMEQSYTVYLPEVGEQKNAILETYTKQHSAEYQAQALIDLAFELRTKITRFEDIEKIVIETSHHTHKVIGTGANDPQKFDPKASRETLDHSIMYIFAVALQDGSWHHVDSYAPKRAQRPDTVELWKKISTVENPKWTEKYHSTDPKTKAFGGRVEIFMKDKTKIVGEKALANAHSFGSAPFKRADYVKKFRQLTENIVGDSEAKRFLQAVERCHEFTPSDFKQLNVAVDANKLTDLHTQGIFN